MPLHPDLERVALLGWLLAPQTRARTGLWKGYRDDATADLDTLEAWQRRWPDQNWCVATGPVSGMWGLDVDRPSADHASDGFAALRVLEAVRGNLPVAPELRSGGGGRCIFFAWGPHAPTSSRSGWPQPGLDIRGPRVVTTIPPSIHRTTGAAYTWTIPPWEVAPPPAPPWLLALCAPPPVRPPPPMPVLLTSDRAQARLAEACSIVLAASPGTRNDTLVRQAWTMGGYVGAGVLAFGTAQRALMAAARAVGQSEAEARSTVDGGLRRGAMKPLGRAA